MMSDNIADMKKALKIDIDKYIAEINGRNNRHRYGNTALILASIVLSAAITISGIFDLGIVAAILGVVLTALLAAQQAFPLGELGFFYRTSLGDLAVLEDNLMYLANTEKDVEKIVRQFGVIKKHVAQNVPRGRALEAIQNMRDDVTTV